MWFIAVWLADLEDSIPGGWILHVNNWIRVSQELAFTLHLSKNKIKQWCHGHHVNMSQKEEEEVVSNAWSHGLHSEISVLHSRMQSCGNRRHRLSGSTADEHPVTVMFHMWQWTSFFAATEGQQKPHLTQGHGDSQQKQLWRRWQPKW